jgi:hypothetical protein
LKNKPEQDLYLLNKIEQDMYLFRLEISNMKNKNMYHPNQQYIQLEGELELQITFNCSFSDKAEQNDTNGNVHGEQCDLLFLLKS